MRNGFGERVEWLRRGPNRAISLYEAMEKHLGLKLEKTKRPSKALGTERRSQVKTKGLVLLLAAWAGYSQTGFDVASIRLHQGPLSRIGDFSISGQRVIYGGYTPLLLVMEAYNLRGYQVATSSTKLPVNDEYYEISAIAPGDAPVTRDDARRMLQVPLKNRFKLNFIANRGRSRSTKWWARPDRC